MFCMHRSQTVPFVGIDSCPEILMKGPVICFSLCSQDLWIQACMAIVVEGLHGNGIEMNPNKSKTLKTTCPKKNKAGESLWTFGF